MSETVTLNQTFPYTCSKGTINGVPVPDDYMDEAALAQQAADTTGHLDKAQWRTLMEAAKSGLPVVIRRAVGANRTDGIAPPDEILTVIVEYVTAHEGSGKVRVRYWGFAHYIWTSEIVSVETPGEQWI